MKINIHEHLKKNDFFQALQNVKFQFILFLKHVRWFSGNARVECFKDVCPLVEKFLPIDKRDKKLEERLAVSKSDRLMQLVIKGILYESCVDYCQHKATSRKCRKNIKKESHEKMLLSFLKTTIFNCLKIYLNPLISAAVL